MRLQGGRGPIGLAFFCTGPAGRVTHDHLGLTSRKLDRKCHRDVMSYSLGFHTLSTLCVEPLSFNSDPKADQQNADSKAGWGRWPAAPTCDSVQRKSCSDFSASSLKQFLSAPKKREVSLYKTKDHLQSMLLHVQHQVTGGRNDACGPERDGVAPRICR